jgi:hypothetical protein
MDVGSSTLEKIRMIRYLFYVLAIVSTLSCTQKFLTHEKSKELGKNKEFEQAVQIVEVPVDGASVIKSSDQPLSPPQIMPPPQHVSAVKDSIKVQDTVKATKGSKSSGKQAVKGNELIATSPRRQPEIESDLGFSGRRPIKDPFRVGEKVVHSVKYFAMKAGTLTLETRPFAMVNGIKNYQFRTSIKTASLFDSFYSVDDYVDVLMDFDQLIPSVFTLHVKESAQLKEAQMFFDHRTNKATYWEKKITEKNGEENKKLEWELSPFSQNVFSAAFYMRIFQWEVGKENAFYVADDEKNLIFRAKALRREKITTPVGEFNAIVIRPEIELKGKYNPVGDNYIWLSDDDRKLILRIESKIKIGTLVSEVIEIQKGRDP